MDALVIKGIEYPLPTDFTLEKWLQLQSIDDKDTLKLISTAFDVPLEELNDMPEKTQQVGIAVINALMYPSQVEPTTDYLINYGDLTLGQFVDLEVHIAKGARETIMEIANILYKNTIKPDTLVSKIWGAFVSYMNYRKLLYTQYKGLFGNDGDNDEAGDNNASSPRTTGHVWYEIIMILADGKFLNIESTVNRPVIEAFNWLAWNKNRIQKEEQQQREAEIKRKAQNYKR